MTADEHLAWAKARALEYVDRGDLQNAVASMASDLTKHGAFRGASYQRATLIGSSEISKGAEAVRRWINGFN